jgi:hypothetical protein
MSAPFSELVSPDALSKLLAQAETELAQIQPLIDALELQVAELRELKLTKQHLLTLKMSLSTLMDTMAQDALYASTVALQDNADLAAVETRLYDFNELRTLKMFHPDAALRQVEAVLRHKQSMNYELFKAVVFHGGKATTEEIKTFLVENNICQPQSGEGFETVPLTEISSRANYLVRKGILHTMGRGVFFTSLGWSDPVMAS